MGRPLPRKSDKDPLYACPLCAFLDARRVSGQRAAETLRIVEEHLLVLRSEVARNPDARTSDATAAAVDALLLPLHKQRRQAIRALVAAGMVDTLTPFITEWLRFHDWGPLQDLATATRRLAQPDPRLLDSLRHDHDHLAAQIEAHDEDVRIRDELRRLALRFSALAQLDIARGLVPLAALALTAAKTLRDATATPIRIPLVPGDRAEKTECSAHRQRLTRRNTDGLL